MLTSSCFLPFQCHRIDRGGKEYRESSLGIHGRSDLCNLYIKNYTILLQFINTAISEDVMVVNNSLESSIAEVKSTQSTNSPWNSSGRSVIFVEIPAFNHSDLAMQMKIPYLISRWLTKTSYVPPLPLYFILMANMEVK